MIPSQAWDRRDPCDGDLELRIEDLDQSRNSAFIQRPPPMRGGCQFFADEGLSFREGVETQTLPVTPMRSMADPSRSRDADS
jgi:hypothetical protein